MFSLTSLQTLPLSKLIFFILKLREMVLSDSWELVFAGHLVRSVNNMDPIG